MEQDRISYSAGMKVNIGNYESADFHVSMSSDVRAKETPEQALKRIAEFVDGELEKKIREHVPSRFENEGDDKW
ncbi:hypothetical protein EBR03_07620 [bacterium]|nr:hypothetical protein [bacterium]